MEIKASIPEKRLPYAVLDNVEICSQVMTEEPSGYQGKARPGLYAEEIVKRI